jgi:hypothetical protein
VIGPRNHSGCKHREDFTGSCEHNGHDDPHGKMNASGPAPANNAGPDQQRGGQQGIIEGGAFNCGYNESGK